MRRIFTALVLTTALCAFPVLAADSGTPAASDKAPDPAAVKEALTPDVHKGYLTTKNTRANKDLRPFTEPLSAEAVGKKWKDLKTSEYMNTSEGKVKNPAYVRPEEAPKGPRDPFVQPKEAPVPASIPKLISPPSTPVATDKPVTPLPESPQLRKLNPADEKTPVAAELSDGTQAVFKADGSVTVVSANGRYRVPPDGVLSLKDGTSFTIENGMRVDK